MGKFEVLKNGTLFIQKANIKDQGQYICFAQNEYGSDKLVVTLSVVAYPTRILEEKMRDIKVLAGKTVHLECRTEGRPVPIVSWILPNHTEVKGSITEHGRVTVTTMGTLTIQKVSVLDRGHYKCIASNPAGTDTATVRLQVVAAPPAILEEKRQLVRAEIGQNLFLAYCKAEGYPVPKITWIMPDNIFLTAPYYGSRINVHSNAEFICMAQNDGGEAVMLVQLEVTDKLRRPIFNNPFNERVVTRVGRTAVLNCSADGQPMPEIIWTLPSRTRFIGTPGFEGSRYHLGTDGTFVIYNSSIEDTGKYRCAAKNKVGYIEKLVVFEVIQKPYILTRPKGIIRGISGQSLFLHCLTDGIQPRFKHL
uniref:Immunoglobulin superfamily member 10-like n=1 Tax=Sinocyclocheilus rhinocerous TaxID=307959 RepID=A0A673G760_9TELE